MRTRSASATASAIDAAAEAFLSTGIAFLLTAAATKHLGQEFLPNFQETDFLMHFVEKPGTSIEAMDRVALAHRIRIAARGEDDANRCARVPVDGR